jgi:ornithine decarboxylase
MNAKIHEGESGRRLWAECVELGIEARKAIIANCHMIKPFIPPVVAGRPWQDHPTHAIASERRFSASSRGRNGTGLGLCPRAVLCRPVQAAADHAGLMRKPGNIPGLAFRRPFLRTTCAKTASCRRNAINSILFLLTPAESSEKLAQLVAMLGQFEQHIEDDTRCRTYCRPSTEISGALPGLHPPPVVSGDARSLCQ